MNRDFEKRDTAEILSKFIASLNFDMLGEQTVETVKMYIADYYAACFAGKKINRRFNDAVSEITEKMSAKGNISVLDSDQHLPAENAAYMNAIFAHGADMDDGNRKSMGHIAAHVMSAVFALAEELENTTWADVFTAITAGYEVFNRIGAMAQPGLVHRGFHSTGTVGVIACAGAAAKLMGLNADKIYNALGIAAIQASGLFIIAESGQACKPLNPANAAKNGIISAKLASAGVDGPKYPLESSKGWFHAMTDEIHYDMLDDLGQVFTVCESYLKPYPSCRHTHCGIEAAITIREKMLAAGKTSDEIKSVKVNIYSNAIRTAGQIVLPANTDDAKFSIHYSLAVALLTGNYTLSDLEKKPSDAARVLTSKTELIPDETMEDTSSGIRGSKVTVYFEDGTELSETVLLPKGDAVNPFTWNDMLRKTEACLSGFDYSAEVLTGNIRHIDSSSVYNNINSLLK